MKHIKSFQLFETLKSYDMSVARKVLLSEFKNLGITDVQIWTDEDIYSDENSYSHEEFKRRLAKGESKNDILDKLIMINIGSKTGNCEIAIKNIDKILYTFDKIGWFPARGDYEYGKWTAPKSEKGGGVSAKKGTMTDMSNLNFPKDTHYIQFVLDPIYDDAITIKDRVFYHVTNKETADKILKEGILPKSHSKRTFYPQRIYLSRTLIGAKGILPQLKYENERNKIGKPGEEYVILKVRIPENIDIYKDTRYKQEGVYILNAVGPDNIELLKQTELKQAA